MICGNGRAFSSGADVHQRQLRRREEFLEHGGPQGWGANSGDLLTRSVNWKPVIAAPHGYAMGLALGIVLECDLIVAAAGTKFQVTETSRGLGGAKYWALLNFRGAAAFATEVTLTGRFFTAEEAHAAGIINRVAPEGRHLEVAYELAAEVAKNPPLSVRATVRTRRWYMDQLEREVNMQTAPLKLYLSRTSTKPPAPSPKSASPAPSRAAERLLQRRNNWTNSSVTCSGCSCCTQWPAPSSRWQPSMRVQAVCLHALEGAGALVDAPVALAGDEHRRHVDHAAGE